MEYAKLSNWKLAEEFCLLSLQTCDSDPLVYNELGVVCFQKKEYEDSIKYFKKTVEIVKDSNTTLFLWSGTLCNLGHSYRKLG